MPKRGMAEFRNVEPGILYQVWLIDGVRKVAVSKPFIHRGNENAQFPDADTNNDQTINLLRKYRMPLHPQ